MPNNGWVALRPKPFENTLHNLRVCTTDGYSFNLGEDFSKSGLGCIDFSQFKGSLFLSARELSSFLEWPSFYSPPSPLPRTTIYPTVEKNRTCGTGQRCWKRLTAAPFKRLTTKVPSKNTRLPLVKSSVTHKTL